MHCVLVSGFCSDWSRLVMSVKLRLSTPGAGKSRHGSARVVACDEALPAPGGALKIAARIGRSADVVIELLSVSNRVDPNSLLIGDRYSKHSHNACLSQLSLSGLGHDKQRPRRSASDARGSHVGCHGVSARDRGSLADSHNVRIGSKSSRFHNVRSYVHPRRPARCQRLPYL